MSDEPMFGPPRGPIRDSLMAHVAANIDADGCPLEYAGNGLYTCRRCGARERIDHHPGCISFRQTAS